jgi:hypothetical protein
MQSLRITDIHAHTRTLGHETTQEETGREEREREEKGTRFSRLLGCFESPQAVKMLSNSRGGKLRQQRKKKNKKHSICFFFSH